MSVARMVRLLAVLSLIFVLGFSTTAIATVPARYNSFKTTDYSYIDITVTEYGEVDIGITTMELFNTNLSAFQISPASENYAQIASFVLSISETEVVLHLGYKGNISTNTTYIQWSMAIHDNVTSYLSDVFTLTNENSAAYYSDTENITYYVWTWSYTTTNPWTKINSLKDSYVNNDFAKFIMFNSDWSLVEFSFAFGKNKFEINANGTSVMQVDGITSVFSGNGTHVFNLQNILGYKEPPYGISYTLSVLLPNGATLNQSSLDAGNATVIQLADDQLLLSVGKTQTIGELSFAFDYNFTALPPEDNNNNNENNSGGEKPTTSGGTSTPATSLLGGTSTYTIIGVAAIAVIFGIIKFLFKREK